MHTEASMSRPKCEFMFKECTAEMSDFGDKEYFNMIELSVVLYELERKLRRRKNASNLRQQTFFQTRHVAENL